MASLDIKFQGSAVVRNKTMIEIKDKFGLRLKQKETSRFFRSIGNQ